VLRLYAYYLNSLLLANASIWAHLGAMLILGAILGLSGLSLEPRRGRLETSWEERKKDALEFLCPETRGLVGYTT